MGAGSGTLMLLVRRAPSVMASSVLVKEIRERGVAVMEWALRPRPPSAPGRLAMRAAIGEPWMVVGSVSARWARKDLLASWMVGMKGEDHVCSCRSEGGTKGAFRKKVSGEQVGDAGLTVGSEENEFAMVVRELGLDLVEVVGIVAGCFLEVVSTESFGS
jgi:hypothetical protein